MKTNEKISVVVPVYNVEKYIKKCINSLINQTYSNLEIILVDDGSTDNSGFLCDKLSNIDNRIKVFHKKNGGLSDTYTQKLLIIQPINIKSSLCASIVLVDGICIQALMWA